MRCRVHIHLKNLLNFNKGYENRGTTKIRLGDVSKDVSP